MRNRLLVCFKIGDFRGGAIVVPFNVKKKFINVYGY